MRYAIAIAATLLFVAPAMAQHAHGTKGPNGGIMEDVAGVHAELVPSGNVITINVLDEAGTPVSTSGFTATALVVNGPDKETVTLSPSGTSALKGETKKAVTPNTQVTLMLKTAAGKTGQARYKVDK